MLTTNLLFMGVILHVFFLFAIFDIYFKSPIIKGLTPIPNPIKPLGKRVVLISSDGLRLDSVFYRYSESNDFIMKNLQKIIMERGSWGVSESHVPTESRPGHVAMLAGIYEDPSSVTKGWKENPVDFDSIFNRSHCTFAWGSSDILNIFFKGLKHDCAYVESYTDEQNFAGDSREYDNWVYRKVKEFLSFSERSAELHQHGIFFFLHLLGQDTSGHADKPHTNKYLENLENVDQLVKKIEDLFNNYYKDEKTTFLLTSDHGMTDWGSHGAGSSEETNTPILIWGAGIKASIIATNRKNINQADIAPLLAILLGSSIPVNSVGIFPFEFLDMSKKQIAEAMYLNSKQICVQYVKTLENIEEHIISWLYFPFKILRIEDLNWKFMWIKTAILSEKYLESIYYAQDLISLCLAGMDYYHNYYQNFLLICVSLTYLIWICFLSLKVFVVGYSSRPLKMSKSVSLAWSSIMLLTFLLISIQKLPQSFYIYAMLPQFLGYYVVKDALVWDYSVEKKQLFKYLNFFLGVLVRVEILVLSFFNRLFLSLTVGIILTWSLMSVNLKNNKLLMLWWSVSGFALGLFCLLPIVGFYPNPTVSFLSSMTLCCLTFIAFSYLRENLLFFSIQLVALFISSWNNYAVHAQFNEKQELLLFNQVLSWSLLIFSFCLLAFFCENLFQNLHRVFTTLSIPFILLTTNYESFFLFFLFVHLTSWIFIEKSVNDEDQIISDFRQAYFFLSYIFLAFFGMGNISSISSFDPAWVRCFLTVFSPFTMSGLILLKTVIPFLVVTCTMRVLTSLLYLPPKKMFTIVLIYCNIMGLNFLFLVQNKGSWLDIGTSISHYVIQQVTIVFLVLLFGISKILFPRQCRYRNIISFDYF